MSDYWRNVRKIGRDAWIALAGYAMMGFTFSGVEAAILNLFYLRLGLGTAFVGTNMALAATGFALASLPAALVVRKIGCRQSMLVAIVGFSLSLLLLSCGAYLSAAILQVALHTLRLLAASFMALYMVASQPLLMTVTRPEERPYAFALLWSLNPLGGLIGNLLGGLLPGFLAGLSGMTLEDPKPYGFSIALSVLVCIPLVVATRHLREGGRPPLTEKTAGWRYLAPYATLAAIGALSFLRAGGESSARTFFNVYLDSELLVSTANIGATMALANLLTIPAAMVMPAIALRIGKLPSLTVSIVGVAGSLAFLALSGSWAMAGFAFVAMCVLSAMFRVVWTLLIQESVEEAWRPVSAAIANLTAGAGFGLMAGGGGYLVQRVGYDMVFLSGAALVILGALTLSIWRKTPHTASSAG
jgi:predicted MFS family arabinose efflux permease